MDVASRGLLGLDAEKAMMCHAMLRQESKQGTGVYCSLLLTPQAARIVA